MQVFTKVKPSPTPSASTVPSDVPASTSNGGGFHLSLNPIEIIGAAPWLLPLLLIVGWVGLLFGWKKLVLMWNMKGQPLRSSPTQGMKEAFRLMWREDVYQVFARNQDLAMKTIWFTWVRYWRWLFAFTLFTVLLGPRIPFLGNFFLLVTVIAWLIGGAHVLGVFRYRHRVLMQMFEVAASEMRYMKGAELNPWAYVIISGWDQVYSPQTTTIMFNTKYRSDDPRNQQAFELHFTSAVSEQHSWNYSWEPANNRVVCEPVPHIPANVEYKFPDTNPWNIFPLGVTATGDEAVWNVSQAPHLLIAGTTGGGKSVTQRTILLHALQSPEWSVVLIDPKMVELSAYRGRPGVLRVAIEIDEGLQLTEQVRQEMSSRYLRMKEAGVNHFKDLQDPPPALLLMVDETFSLLSPSGLRSEEGKEIDAMKARIGALLSDIARLGRAAGIHLALATQRPDAKVLPGELKANLDARIAQGRMDMTPSMMTLDSDAATRLPAIKGRAMLRTGSDYTEFQAYFLPPQFLPQVLEMCAYAREGGDLSALMTDEAADQVEASAGNPLGAVASDVKEKLSHLHMPSVNTGFIGKIKSWAAQRQAQIDERELGAGRTEEARTELSRRKAEREEKRAAKKAERDAQFHAEQEQEANRAVEISDALSARSVDEALSQLSTVQPQLPDLDPLFPVKRATPDSETARTQRPFRTPPVIPDALATEVHAAVESLPATTVAATPPAMSAAGYVEEDEDEDFPVLEEDDFGYVDDLSLPTVSSDAAVSVPSVPVPVPAAMTSPIPDSPPPVAPAAPSPFAVAPTPEPEEETPLAGPGFDLANMTVQDVIQRAAERGVPIPASELLAALKAEAARQKNAPTAAVSAATSTPDVSVPSEQLPPPSLTPRMPQSVIPAPPNSAPEADEEGDREVKVAKEDLMPPVPVLERPAVLTTPAEATGEISPVNEKKPGEAPWMPPAPRQPVTPGPSPFGVPSRPSAPPKPPQKPVTPPTEDSQHETETSSGTAEDTPPTSPSPSASFRLPPPPPPPRRG